MCIDVAVKNGDLLSEISGIVADAVNQESFDSLAEDINETLDGVASADRRGALAKAFVTCVMASEPGCLPDSWTAFPSNARPEDIREEIMSVMGGDDFEDEENDWEAIREKVNGLDLAGAAIDAPDGRVIEVFRKSCVEILQENGVAA